MKGIGRYAAGVLCVTLGWAGAATNGFAASKDDMTEMQNSLYQWLSTTPGKPVEVLSPTGVAGDFDAVAVESMVVLEVDGRFYMFYFGHDTGREYRTGLAVSSDLLHWERRGLILDHGGPGSFDSNGAALVTVLSKVDIYGARTPIQYEGKYWGMYTGFDVKGFEAGRGSIGLVYSEDLEHWTKCTDINPVLTPNPSAEWEKACLFKPYLLEYKGTFYCFYNANNSTQWPWREQTGLAVSHDIKHWERVPGNPLLPHGPEGSYDSNFASDPYVVHTDAGWAMLYASFNGSRAGIGLAWSQDLRVWKKEPAPILSANEELDIHASKPCIVSHEGRTYLFVNGVRSIREGDPDSARAVREYRAIYVYMLPKNVKDGEK